MPATVSRPDLGCAKQPVNDGSGGEGEEEGGADVRAAQRSGMERNGAERTKIPRCGWWRAEPQHL